MPPSVVRTLIAGLGMQSRLYRVVSGLAIGAAIITLGAVSSGCSSEESREAVAVREFHQRLEQGRVDLIYANASELLKGQLSEAQFRHFLAQTRVLGRLEASERAHYDRTPVEGGSDLVLAFYNSRYSKASCLESFSWQVEKEGLKLAAYSCARDMQVSCPGGVAGAKCETSPAPALGLASLP
jgi:hypothetical protein